MIGSAPAFALDPENRAQSLKDLLEAYGAAERVEEVNEWILDRVKKYTPTEVDPETPPTPTERPRGRQILRHNAFASRRTAAVIKDSQDVWTLYNAEASPFGEASANETLLQYWARHDKTTQMRPLAKVARDILGLAGSSASVERLFSAATRYETARLLFQLREARSAPNRFVPQMPHQTR
jgi:hypothetical protein